MMGRSGVGGRRPGLEGYVGARPWHLVRCAEKFDCSAAGNEATTGRFSWTSGELMFYVASATWHGL